MKHSHSVPSMQDFPARTPIPTPSTEILEYVQKNALARERGIHSHWSSNEKTALEEALGMSFCGKRSMVSMKHVGMNVAADPFVNSAMTGANGGFMVIVHDDPSMHSSQNEQDSRFYADFAMIPAMEPSCQQEAYDMASYAFDLSENFGIPVLMRLVTRLSHSRAVVETCTEARAENGLSYPANPRQWVLMPGYIQGPQPTVDCRRFQICRGCRRSHRSIHITRLMTTVSALSPTALRTTISWRFSEVIARSPWSR